MNTNCRIYGSEYDVAVNGIEGNVASVTVNGTEYSVEIEGDDKAENKAAVTAPAPAETRTAAAHTGGRAVKSPLPGVIVEICVQCGDSVKRGQKVAVLEAMKMENEILAESDGTVTAIHAAKGDAVLEGASIVTIG